jgi:hypothetical protein
MAIKKKSVKKKASKQKKSVENMVEQLQRALIPYMEKEWFNYTRVVVQYDIEEDVSDVHLYTSEDSYVKLSEAVPDHPVFKKLKKIAKPLAKEQASSYQVTIIHEETLRKAINNELSEVQPVTRNILASLVAYDEGISHEEALKSLPEDIHTTWFTISAHLVRAYNAYKASQDNPKKVKKASSGKISTKDLRKLVPASSHKM